MRRKIIGLKLPEISGEPLSAEERQKQRKITRAIKAGEGKKPKLSKYAAKVREREKLVEVEEDIGPAIEGTTPEVFVTAEPLEEISYRDNGNASAPPAPKSSGTVAVSDEVASLVTLAFNKAGHVKFLKLAGQNIWFHNPPRSEVDINLHDYVLVADHTKGQWQLTRYFRLALDREQGEWQSQPVQIPDSPFTTAQMMKALATWSYVASHNNISGYKVPSLRPGATLVTKDRDQPVPAF